MVQSPNGQCLAGWKGWKLEVEGWRAWKLSADEVSAERLSHHLSISAGEAHFPLDRH